ncbi:MAG TPA: NADH:flavin oxidoreductase/NADH oxidase [Rhizobiaceae bacterium]|nr:NADH:flavin oxidoreductase/NADH oxidase [Rhizobiaceae bacterium]
MSAALFQPIQLGGLEFANRIAVAPMCQYSADDGSVTDWHLQHWMNLGMSGASMITVEMTDVERRGRISHGCAGLYSDHNEVAAKRTLAAARLVSPEGTRFGVQIAHAGRKASCQRPWEGGGPLNAHQDPWQTVSASALPFNDGWHTPHALEDGEIVELIGKFADSARRAVRAGFDFIEIHGAHGYLINQFLSPLSNQRTDRWGGSFDNRLRFAREIMSQVVAAVPGMMVGIRLSITEWVDGGLSVQDGINIAAAMREAGAAYICCSSGGNAPHQKVPTGAGYQVHLAEMVRKQANVPTRAVGLITDPVHAEQIVADGHADMVAIARAVLADPRWPWRAAVLADEPIHSAPQLARSFPTMKHWMQPQE